MSILVPEIDPRETEGQHVRVRAWAREHRTNGIDAQRVCEQLRLAEAQGVDDFSSFADQIDRGMNLGASENTVRTSYKILGWREDFDTFEAKDVSDAYGSFLATEVPAGANYPAWNASDTVYTSRVKKYGWIWPMTMEAWLRSKRDVDILGAQPARWALAAEYTKQYMFTSAYAANSTYFSSGNGNLVSAGSSTPWYLFADPMVRPAIHWGQVRGMGDAEVFIRNSDAAALIGGGAADPWGGAFANDAVELKLRFSFGCSMLHPSAAYRSDQALTSTYLEEALEAFRALPDPAGNINAYLGRVFLVVPPSLEFTAKALVESQGLIMGGTAGSVTYAPEMNVLKNSCTVVVDDFLGTLDSAL